MPAKMNPATVNLVLLGRRVGDREQLERRAFQVFGEQRCGQHRSRTHHPRFTVSRSDAWPPRRT
jgi:hypothetical protein